MSFEEKLTKNCLKKINQMQQSHLNRINKNSCEISKKNSNNLATILENMMNAYIIPINIEKAEQENISVIKSVLTDFDKNINKIHNSKFQKDVDSMRGSLTLHLVVGKSKITVNILCDDVGKNINSISVIMHALHTFCNMFPHDYNQLTVYVSLDDNCRDLNGVTTVQVESLDKIYQHFKLNSLAFNASGVTNKYFKKVVLTRKEEIIKLLFHEMAHYAGLDENIRYDKKYNWAIKNSMLNLSEAYTEFVSVLLHSAYISLHLSNDNNYHDIFHTIYCSEIDYSSCLSAKILQFFGCSKKIDNFFKGVGEKIYCPIYVWEYILLRTVLMNKTDDVLNITKCDLELTKNNCENISNLMTIDSNFLNRMNELTITPIKLDNISYLLFDVDWNTI